MLIKYNIQTTAGGGFYIYFFIQFLVLIIYKYNSFFVLLTFLVLIKYNIQTQQLKKKISFWSCLFKNQENMTSSVAILCQVGCISDIIKKVRMCVQNIIMIQTVFCSLLIKNRSTWLHSVELKFKGKKGTSFVFISNIHTTTN